MERARKQSSRNMYMCLRLLYGGGNDLYWITEKEVIVMDVDREIILREYPLHLFSTVSTYLLMENRISCIVYCNGRDNPGPNLYELNLPGNRVTPI
ncbi:hypothetical protein QL285_004804 [Trifolium repens]|nr:hypothetical protein QL285_004804 [Trifolium repens]